MRSISRRHHCELGRLEYALYLILEAIDPAQGEKWTGIFTSAHSTKMQRDAVRNEVFVEVTDEQLREQLETVLARFEALCSERNLLAHSVWRRIESGRYELVPLQWERKKRALKERKVVTGANLRKVARELDFVRQHIVSLVTEFIAYRELRRIDEKRRAAVDAGDKSRSDPN